MYRELSTDLVKLAKTDVTFKALLHLCYSRGDTYTQMLEISLRNVSFQKRMMEQAIIKSEQTRTHVQAIHMEY